MSYQIILSDRMIPIGSRPQINPYLTRPAKVIVDPPEYPEETSSEGWLIDDVSQFLLAKESNELSNLIKPYGLFFNDDGSLAYTFDTETGYIIKFTCSDYDVTTLSYDSSKFVLNKVSNFYLDKTGTYLFLSLNYSSAVYVYKMGTAWDISTIYYLNRESFGSTPTTSIYVSDNGFHLYIGTNENKILHYRMDYPLDINTIVYKDFIDISSEVTTSSSGIVVSPDGTKMYILQLNSPELFQYELSTPYYLDGTQYEDKNISLTDDTSMSGLYVTNENNFFSYGFNTNIIYNYTVLEFNNATITTLDATNITTTSVTLNGSLLDDEYGTLVTETGFYWSNTNSNPTSLDNSSVAGSSVGSFSLSITDLDPGTTYYYKAYATAGEITITGNIITFDMESSIVFTPIVFTNTINKGSHINFGAVGLSTFTMEFWFKDTGSLTYANLFWPFFNNNNYDSLLLQRRGSYEYGIVFSGTNVNVSDGQFHKFVLTRSGTTYKFYFDSVLKSTSSPSIDITRNWYIGTPTNVPGDNYALRGEVKNIAIYNYAKSSTQIISEQNTLPALDDSGVVRIFNGEILDNQLIDIVGNANAILVGF